MKIHHLIVGPLQVNCFLLMDESTNEAILIDPGDNAPDILSSIRQADAQVTRITNTHAHFDHILAVPEIKEATGATFHLHHADQPILDNSPEVVRLWLGTQWGPPPVVDAYLDPDDELNLGETQFEIRHVPGHSPGSIIFIDHEDRRAWIGDTVFAGGIGRTDFPGCSFPDLIEAIHTQILTLPDDYILYPGHGPFTTVGQERRTNAYLTVDVRMNAHRY